MAPERGVLLDIGDVVGGAIEVRVNGELVAPDAVPGRTWDISDLLEAGSNEIKVDLATTLRNVYTAERGGDTTQVYGLLGPVQLTPYGRVVINAASGR